MSALHSVLSSSVFLPQIMAFKKKQKKKTQKTKKANKKTQNFNLIFAKTVCKSVVCNTVSSL